MNHPFYHKPAKEQLRIQLMIGLTVFVINCLFLLFSIWSGIYLVVILSFALTLSVVAPFFDTPALCKSGKLIYYAPLFLAEKVKKGTITVHGGTLFDYVFVIDRALSGRQRTNFIITNYLEGILRLIASYDNRSGHSITVRGTSYILNERTAKKIGFRVVRTDAVQKLILIYNYLNLLISNSIAKAKLTFPNLEHVKTYEADLNDLIERRDAILRLKERLESMQAKTA